MKRNLEPDLDDDLASAIAPEDDEDRAYDAPAASRPFDPNLLTRSKGGVNGFSIMPSWALQELMRVRAYHAVPLALVVFKKMRLRREATIPLTLAIWDEAGSPGERERQTVLQHLRRAPGVLRLEERHKRLTRYQVTLGEMWD